MNRIQFGSTTRGSLWDSIIMYHQSTDKLIKCAGTLMVKKKNYLNLPSANHIQIHKTMGDNY